MRKFLLALIGCLVAVIAYAGPGTPYLSYGWRPTGGGTSIALDGTEKDANSGLSSVTTLNVTLSTSGTNRAIYCAISAVGGTTATGMGISGSSLGAFTSLLSASRTSQYVQIFFKYASSQVTSEVITATWTNTNNGFLSCIALSGAKDVTALVPGTDFATATLTSPSGTDDAVSLTTKAASSWTFGIANHWSANTYTADANNTLYGSHVPGSLGSAHASFFRSDEPLAVGTYSTGVTAGTSDNRAVAALEVLKGP